MRIEKKNPIERKKFKSNMVKSMVNKKLKKDSMVERTKQKEKKTFECL
jgi:hypothetical protein